MPAQTLREYQRHGIGLAMNAFRKGARSVLMVSPTGSGKTTMFGHMVAELVGKQRRALILAHRRELVEQASKRLHEFGVPHGLIMAGMPPRPYERAQIGTVPTIIRRDPSRWPAADLVIPDEAHLSTAASWTSVLDGYPNARILGFTATPWRLGGKPLAGAYDACVVVATPRELREQGFLCDYSGFSYLTPDLSGVKTTGGDYNDAQAGAVMGDSLIVDNVVEEWLKHSRELSTVVFAATIEHSKALVARFVTAGVKAEHIDGDMPTSQREAVLKRVARGDTHVFSNVGVVVEGLDVPRLKCCVLARPTKSLARAIQMMGRVRRPWRPDGKPCTGDDAATSPSVPARIHDHAFVIKSHGLPDQDRDYNLDAKPSVPPSFTTCEQCRALYVGTRCTACSAENEPVILGERVLKTVADAEQYAFTSAEAETERIELAMLGDWMPPKPPVKVTWDNHGRSVEGVVLRKYTEPTSWGVQTRYVVKGKKREYDFPSTAVIDARFRKAGVDIGHLVHVTYTDDTALHGGKSRKEFDVEVDDGQPEVHE